MGIRTQLAAILPNFCLAEPELRRLGEDLDGIFIHMNHRGFLMLYPASPLMS
jgi:hypothetical protein